MNKLSWHTEAILTANTAKDGTGQTAYILTAEEQDLYVDRVVFQPIGTNVQSVGRLFLNNGKLNTHASNNSPFAEITLPATTLDETTAMTSQTITTDLWLPKGYRLNVTLGTTVAAGYRVTAVCGDYQDLQSHPFR